ncbi:MAG: DUF429 domain-containing protein [candidate division WOR-3 bacterium]|nr:DUF429 domain-containing protein [candidate division WOR-3 bacterium]MCX7947285.1 DUF429 domain-containing protein [candidate division WOR-3 bacterium]MDW8150158.1 DUF429 domain-containing protein [candidate division WOR-3 bacterium]
MVLGIDLSVKRYSYLAYFDNKTIRLKSLFHDEEIINFSKNFSIVLIDAPLSLPRKNKHFRDIDIYLKKRRINVLPITFKHMKELALRGISIKNILEMHGILVFETFPSAFNGHFFEFINGLGYSLEKQNLIKDEKDAIICLLAGKLYLENKAGIIVGTEGKIVII